MANLKPIEEMTIEEFRSQRRTVDEFIRWGNAQGDTDATRHAKELYEADKAEPWTLEQDLDLSHDEPPRATRAPSPSRTWAAVSTSPSDPVMENLGQYPHRH